MLQNNAVEGKRVFIMGGGKFGTNALCYFKSEGAKILVVDLNPECRTSSEVDSWINEFNSYESLENGQAALLVGDATDVLRRQLETEVPDFVVTAIPGNAVAKVVENLLGNSNYKIEPYRKNIAKILDNLPKSLVSFVDEKSGVIIVSYMPAHMLCRENCLPPKDFCALTGRPKIASMDRLLRFCLYNLVDVTVIVRSSQLKGGLGAIKGKELHSLLKQLKNLKTPCTIAIGTACECHGIINLTKIR